MKRHTLACHLIHMHVFFCVCVRVIVCLPLSKSSPAEQWRIPQPTLTVTAGSKCHPLEKTLCLLCANQLPGFLLTITLGMKNPLSAFD